MVAGAWEIILGIAVAVAVGLWLIRAHDRRKYPAGDETGDGMNLDALRDWRKAKWKMERGE
jgi:hypothetical protein